MVHALARTFIFLAVLKPAFAFGQSSCLPGFTALQTFEVIESNSHFTHGLISQKSGEEFRTRVELEGRVDHGSLKLKIQFDPAFDGVSLPYNLYAVMILANGQPLAWYDYTRGCSGSGISFFPGRAIELPALKIPTDSSQKLQIMVWGKL